MEEEGSTMDSHQPTGDTSNHLLPATEMPNIAIIMTGACRRVARPALLPCAAVASATFSRDRVDLHLFYLILYVI